MNSSPLLQARRRASLELPAQLEDLLRCSFTSAGQSKARNDEEEIHSQFSKLYGAPFLKLEKGNIREKKEDLKIAVVLSGGQAAGGHNVICGIFEGMKKLSKKITLYGFMGGPSGVFNGKYKILKEEELSFYRNTGGFDLIGSGRDKIETQDQLEKSLTVCKKLNLDGLVIVGGDDSNTNAAVLAEYFSSHDCHTSVIGVPKTIDGDLQNSHVDISFGFDTACRTYSEMIGNIARDALSAKKYTHFIKLMGRSASHIALECALQTHPNLTLIGEEISSKKMTLKEITSMIVDVIVKRSDMGKSYGLILIPEGVIEQIEEIKILIKELNAQAQQLKEGSDLSKILSKEAFATFSFLPLMIQKQLLMDRDPHGNVQVAHIETEKLLIETVTKELLRREFKGKFSFVSHFFGYEGRAGYPSYFDSHYCYALGVLASLLIDRNKTGYMAAISDLIAPVSHWSACAIPLTSLMHMETRKGKRKAVIEKALVDLNGAAFKIFSSRREHWKQADDYVFPGPLQFYGDPSLYDQRPMIIQIK